ncbi:MAG: ATP-binding protein [Deltaproteobacteria bacterium]|nr:ATP-binding protein [Deltaproteobacteria bacterium]
MQISDESALELSSPEQGLEAPPSVVRRGLDLRSRRLRTTHRLVLYVAGVPTLALISVGIIVTATGSAAREVVIGVLILGMALTVATGVVVTSILLQREARLARLQSEFVSRVSHDLRTPLTSIRMFVETLQLGRAQDPETTAECLDALGRESERLLSLVDRLLDWARIESASRLYEARRCTANTVLDEALQSVDSLRRQYDVTFVKEYTEGLPDIEVDAKAIVDALTNVLQNAVYYADAPRMVWIRTHVVGAMLEVAVADNGPGVPERERKKIFEKFYRGSAARSQGIKGTGLGLTMVRAIVNAHRGEVRVEANEPRGSVFVLSLPLADTPR